MATLFSDGFTGNNWDDINEAGLPRQNWWTYDLSLTGTPRRFYMLLGRAHCGAPGSAYVTTPPPTADYKVESDFVMYTNQPSLYMTICLRMQPGANTYYGVFYQDGQLVLDKHVAGVSTWLGTWAGSLSYGPKDSPPVYRITLEAVGSALAVKVNGVERISATDGDITAKGHAGVLAGTFGDAYTGIHLDNFAVSDDTTITGERTQVVGLVGW